MPTEAVEKLMERVRTLTPDQLLEFRALMDEGRVPKDPFEKMLFDSGIGQPRLWPARQPNPLPVQVTGKPVSEQLIEERR